MEKENEPCKLLWSLEWTMSNLSVWKGSFNLLLWAMVEGVGKSCAPSPARLEGQQCEPEPRTLFSLWQKQLDWKEFWVLILNAFISKCEQILFLLLPAASLWFPKQLMVSSSSELPHYKSCITSNSHISTFIWCHVDLLLVPFPLWFIILMHFGWITASASDSSFPFFLS